MKQRTIHIPAHAIQMTGDLTYPDRPEGVILFAHGSGSSRLSPRNRWVAERLNHAGFGTLLLDLLTPEEEADRRNVFDISLLTERLVVATRRLQQGPHSMPVPVGYFGASTGAAAALSAAAALGRDVSAVVSRGGRPDLADGALSSVKSPTLLIVGGADREVLALNEAAATHLRCEHEIAVVPDATHLFEEPGALAQVSDLATDWFLRIVAGKLPAAHTL